MGDCEQTASNLKSATFTITETQRFSTHNGPGIRTTVFFKGCPLKCAWCHNPETLSLQEPPLSAQGSSFGSSLGSSLGLGPGHPYTVAQLLEIALKDQAFFDASNGGITLSGGEVLLQDTDLLCHLFITLKRHGLHIALDTCGYVDQQKLMQLAPYVDLFLYDVKLMDPILHEHYTGVTNSDILDNLRQLLLHSKCAKNDSNYEVELRLPLIAGMNDDDGHIKSLLAYLEPISLPISLPRVALLPYHQMANHKYEKMGLPLPSSKFKTPSQQQLEHLAQILVHKGFQVSIGG